MLTDLAPASQAKAPTQDQLLGRWWCSGNRAGRLGRANMIAQHTLVVASSSSEQHRANDIPRRS